MPPRDAEATRRRLLEAATAEFAARGIAGARVDRIAAAASANKNLIYIYFGSKDKLFDAVFDALIVRTLDEVPLDPDDLPGYAVGLWESYVARPEVMRVATWYRLERGDLDEPLEAILASNRGKLAAIEAAQRDGRLPDRFSALQLLGLVLAIAGMWSGAVREFQGLLPDGEEGRALQRETIRDAVELLLAPASP